MRKALIVLASVVFLVSALDARKPSSKAGSVKDGIYTDNVYKFSMKLLDNWPFSVEAAKSQNRLSLTQKNYTIPPDYTDAKDYTMIPRLVLFVGETNMNAFEFLDSLLSPSYESNVKKEIVKEVEILRREPNRENVVTRKKSTITVDGQRCVLWTGAANYVQEVSKSASDLGGKRVYGGYGGAIWVITKGGTVVVANLVSERDYFDAVLTEASQMVNSIHWPGENEVSQEGAEPEGGETADPEG